MTTTETWRLDDLDVTITHPDKLYWPDEGITKDWPSNNFGELVACQG